jgi:hypothetical protein
MNTVDLAHLAALDRFRKEVADLPNEAAKTHRFIGLVAELFPGSDIVSLMSQGIEKTVRLGAKRGRIDSDFGNAVIEFEKDLTVSLATAEHQLREQVAGLWNGEETPERPLVAIASDGLQWECYRPRLAEGAASPFSEESVELDKFHSVRLTEANVSAFWLWLTGLLFRQGSIRPDASRFRHDFGSTSLAYRDSMRSLQRVWSEVGKTGEARVAFDTWRRYLNVTYGQLAEADAENPSDETVQLFLKHTYLAVLARFLVWASLSRGQAAEGFAPVIRGCLTGSYFRDRNIENLVESDFFQWVQLPEVIAGIAPIWERVLVQVLTYDLGYLDEDVLKGIYQELVDPKDRHDLGEYYTPEWLCERLVDEMLPAEGVCGVLDPTCGSGSFLRAALAHFLRANPHTEPAELLGLLIENVVGIDIHPLAVTIARATYVLALRDLITHSRRPVQIPVYLADSLFLPEEMRAVWNNGRNNVEIKFGLQPRKSFELPACVLDSPAFFDAVVTAGYRVAADHARTGKESLTTLRKALERDVPDLTGRSELDDLVEHLWDYVKGLAELIDSHSNSIWAFIIRNTYRPALLRGRFDVILGNPPWLSYRYIADPEYQAEVKKRAVDEYGIAPRSQKLFTQMELATVFLVHSLKVFGKDKARLAFVMPRSVLTADQHHNFRMHSHRAPAMVTAYWDLFDVRPLFNVPSCVVFAERSEQGRLRFPRPDYTFPCQVWNGRLPEKNATWAEAKKRLKAVKQRSKVARLGTRTAFSAAGPEPGVVESSVYRDMFHQGATIVPRNFYFVTVNWPKLPFDPDRVYHVETDREQARTAKPPYNELLLSGQAEGRFLFKTVIAKHVLPFLVLEPVDIVLPVTIEEDRARLLTSRELKDDGYRYVGNWMEEAETLWNKHRGAKAERQTTIQRLDYGRGLSSQRLGVRYLVLYNAAGTNISAAVFDRNKVGSVFFVDAKLYHYATPRLREADYLTAILNSESVNARIKPFQSVGLQGKRDVHKKVLELPISRFDQANPIHSQISALGAAARTKLDRWFASRPSGWPKSLARQRAIVRLEVRDILGQTDELVKQLLSGGGV